MKSLTIYLFSSLAFGLSSCSADSFTKGRTVVTVGNYTDAIVHLNEYLKKNPEGKDASRAHFFIAKAQLGLGDFTSARETFERIQVSFPASLEAHKSRYKLAMLDLVEGNRERALSIFRDLANQPDGPLAPEAKMMAEFLAGQ